MSKISWPAGIMLAPVPPALISCGTQENPNLITVAWTGVIATQPPTTYISVRKERFSHPIISENKEFVINLSTIRLAEKTDLCGVKSGKDINKFKEFDLTPAPCTHVSCPQVLESPVSIECKVTQVIECGSHDMFIAEIVSVNVDDKYIDENGKFCMEKTGLLAYAHGNYYTLGRELGKYGFSVEKDKTAPYYQPKSARMQKRRDDLNDFDKKRSFGDRKPYGDKKPFGDRPRRDGDRKPFGEKRDFGDRKPFGDRPRRDGDRKPFGEKRDFGDRKPFGDRPRRDGDRKPFGEKRDFGDRKPFGDKGPKKEFNKKPFNKPQEKKEPLSLADIKKKRKTTTIIKK